MLVAVALEPESAAATGILAEWRAAWGVKESGDGIELAPAVALAAMLDLKARCYDRGLTVNATFPDNT